MRFWQAVVVAQMAAGAVYADHLSGHPLLHIATDLANLALGAVMWITFKAAWGD